MESEKIQMLLKELLTAKVDDVVAFTPTFLNVEDRLIITSLQANVVLSLNIKQKESVKDEKE